MLLALLQRNQGTRTKELTIPFTKGFDFPLDEVACSSQLVRKMGRPGLLFSVWSMDGKVWLKGQIGRAHV